MDTLVDLIAETVDDGESCESYMWKEVFEIADRYKSDALNRLLRDMMVATDNRLEFGVMMQFASPATVSKIAVLLKQWCVAGAAIPICDPEKYYVQRAAHSRG